MRPRPSVRHLRDGGRFEVDELAIDPERIVIGGKSRPGRPHGHQMAGVDVWDPTSNATA
ncbi:hypothetical protein ACFQ7Z_31615 [Streptomyces virginiae]|uniref:hypothetical protein n=1 Tax=Streptomyces virginiae TaxID=1961 RepID=UPI0036CB61FB